MQSPTGADAANTASAPDSLRLAELVAALSLATDLGTGQPLERAIRACLVATQLAERLNLSSDERADVYYLPLLAMLGCTAESSDAAVVFGDELAFGAAVAPFFLGQPHETVRWMLAHFAEDEHLVLRAARLVRAMVGSGQVMEQAAAAHCEVAQGLGDRLGFGTSLRDGLGAIYSRWDGTGKPRRSRDEIPLATRILHVAWDAQLFHRLGGEGTCVEMARARAGGALDPEIVDVLCRGASDVLAVLNAPSAWDAVLALEPRPWRVIPQSQMDDIVSVFADFADLKTRWLHGHSRRVANLAEEAARQHCLPAHEVGVLRRAALVHDLGRVGISAGVWNKRNPLTPPELERVRLHAYYTERVLAQAPTLTPLASIAGAHHERLDGSGYHRGSQASGLPASARILAAADMFEALTQPRPHRPARAPAEAADILRSEARIGRLDRDATDAVLSAAGQAVRSTRRSYPGGLTGREVEVLRLLARGLSNRAMATALSISESTVHHHIQHIYDKIGVSTRAAATLFAMQHDLLL